MQGYWLWDLPGPDWGRWLCRAPRLHPGLEKGGVCCEIQPLQIDQSHTLQVAGPTESELPWGETRAGPHAPQEATEKNWMEEASVLLSTAWLS